MNWKQPHNVWQWMLLSAPAVGDLLALWAADTWMPRVPRYHVREGLDVVNVGAELNRMALISVSTITVLSLLLAFAFTRNQPWPRRIANTLGVALILVLLNSFVAFGGCMLVSAGISVVSR